MTRRKSWLRSNRIKIYGFISFRILRGTSEKGDQNSGHKVYMPKFYVSDFLAKLEYTE